MDKVNTQKRTATGAELAALAADINRSFLTVDALADLLGKSRGQIQYLRRKGILPEPRKIAGTPGLRWTTSDIAAYLESLKGAG